MRPASASVAVLLLCASTATADELKGVALRGITMGSGPPPEGALPVFEWSSRINVIDDGSGGALVWDSVAADKAFRSEWDSRAEDGNQHVATGAHPAITTSAPWGQSLRFEAPTSLGYMMADGPLGTDVVFTATAYTVLLSLSIQSVRIDCADLINPAPDSATSASRGEHGIGDVRGNFAVAWCDNAGTTKVVFGASNDSMFNGSPGTLRHAEVAVALDTPIVILVDYADTTASLEVLDSLGVVGTDSYDQSQGLTHLDDSRFVLGRDQQWTTPATVTDGDFLLFGVALYDQVLDAGERASEASRYAAW